MIIVIVRAEVDPDRIPELRPVLDTMMRETWAESGCLSYSMAIENEADGIISIVERWEDEAALRSHFGTEHMELFNRSIKDAIRTIDAKIYDAANERPLMA